MAVASKTGALTQRRFQKSCNRWISERQDVAVGVFASVLVTDPRSGVGRRLPAASASRSRPMERASLRATFRLRCAERIAPSELSKARDAGIKTFAKRFALL